MDPKRNKKVKDTGPAESTEKRTVNPLVSWFAIFLGVGMTAIGVLMVLWGLAWQTGVGEPNQIDGSDLEGYPWLLPIGILMAAFGIMWVWTGWHRFKREEAEEGMKPCPMCRRMVESDLNFCYYCNESFGREKKEEAVDEGGEGTRRARPFKGKFD
ncbi:MAG: hypothetical protein ACMUIE_05205 [Thermoplasmatota archaeon]